MNSIKGDLFQLFKQQGLDQDLKAHMRAKLLSRLQGQRKVKVEGLGSRILCSLFLDFLKSQGFQYTASVFVPECSESLLSVQEVAEALEVRLPPSENFLSHVLEVFQRSQKRPHLMDSASQTEDTSVHSTVEEKLRQIELDYIKKTRSDYNPESIEERMLKYQRECDQRLRTELQTEVARVREIEVSNMRMEEHAKYRQQLQKSRKELEDYWKQELEALKERERDYKERLTIKEKDFEAKEFASRQEMLKDMERLKIKEAQMKKNAELELEAARLQKESWNAKKQETEQKLRELEALRTSLHNKAHEEFLKYKREFDESMEQSQRQLFNDKMEVDSMKKNIEFEYLKAKETIENAEELNKEIRELKTQLETSQQSNEQMRKEMTRLNEDLRNTKESAKKEHNMLIAKDREYQFLKNEHEASKQAYQQTIENARYERSDFRSSRPINYLSGLDELEYISNKKVVWQQLENEAASIKREMMEAINSQPLHTPDPFASIKLPQRSTIQVHSHYSPKTNTSPQRKKASSPSKTMPKPSQKQEIPHQREDLAKSNQFSVKHDVPKAKPKQEIPKKQEVSYVKEEVIPGRQSLDESKDYEYDESFYSESKEDEVNVVDTYPVTGTTPSKPPEVRHDTPSSNRGYDEKQKFKLDFTLKQDDSEKEESVSSIEDSI